MAGEYLHKSNGDVYHKRPKITEKDDVNDVINNICLNVSWLTKARINGDEDETDGISCNNPQNDDDDTVLQL